MKDTADDLDPDVGAIAREYVACMSRADRLRWLDAMILEVGGSEAPIPVFEDIRDDAHFWAQSCLREVLKVYLAAIWNALSDADQDAFDKWREKQRKNGGIGTRL